MDETVLKNETRRYRRKRREKLIGRESGSLVLPIGIESTFSPQGIRGNQQSSVEILGRPGADFPMHSILRVEKLNRTLC